MFHPRFGFYNDAFYLHMVTLFAKSLVDDTSGFRRAPLISNLRLQLAKRLFGNQVSLQDFIRGYILNPNIVVQEKPTTCMKMLAANSGLMRSK